jgi:hypothetical protein
MVPSEYWRTSRQARYSFTFALPLLLLYEGLAAALSQSAFAGVRNGADVLLKMAFMALGGRSGIAVFGLLLLGVGVWVVWHDARKHPGPFKIRVLGLMLAESMVYAALFGTVASVLTALLLSGPLALLQTSAGAGGGAFGGLSFESQLVVSLGAGLYEELLFRVLLVSGLVGIGLALGWRRRAAVGVAVVVSALIFSGFHYLGPLGDPLTLPSFTYRFIAGLLLSGLYVARGFGITAWTHALYDVGLALFG